MDEKAYRCPGPFPSPMPRWMLWVIILVTIGLSFAVGLPMAIEAAREDAIRHQRQQAEQRNR